METVSLTIPESQELETAAGAALEHAKNYVIENNENYQDAAMYRDQCLAKVEEGDALFKDAKEDANRVHKRLVALHKAATERWNDAAKQYKAHMIFYDEEQERLRRKKQAEA